jgi:hypothetical protein
MIITATLTNEQGTKVIRGNQHLQIDFTVETDIGAIRTGRVEFQVDGNTIELLSSVPVQAMYNGMWKRKL